MNTSRIVSWFSCGAASAVATKLAIAENKALGLPFVIVYTEVVEEHTTEGNSEEWDFEGLWAELKTMYPVGITVDEVLDAPPSRTPLRAICAAL